MSRGYARYTIVHRVLLGQISHSNLVKFCLNFKTVPLVQGRCGPGAREAGGNGRGTWA